MNETKNRILQTVQEYRQIAASKGYVLPIVPIDFSLRGACAGKAIHKKFSGQPVMLKFNLELAHRNIDTFLKRTVPHEVAHLLQFMRNPNSKPHGHEWDFFCRLLTGSTMPRCHSYDTTGIKRTRKVTRPYKYVCNCERPHMLTSIKHKRILDGVGYRCVKCSAILKQYVTSFTY